MRIAIEIQYLGEKYVGWQKQKNGVSIQGEIEKAIQEAFGQKIEIFGSGRTDAGVNALNQVAHFDIENTKIPADKLYLMINKFLPNDIRVKSSYQVSDNFHARYDVKKKTYRYMFYLSKEDCIFYSGRAVRLDKDYDIDKMLDASKVLIGKHDFTSFCKMGKEEKNCEREIFDIKINETQSYEKELNFIISGSGFLHNMVRILVSTLISVGVGELTKTDVENILNSKNRNFAPKTLSGSGLYLYKVEY